MSVATQKPLPPLVDTAFAVCLDGSLVCKVLGTLDAVVLAESRQVNVDGLRLELGTRVGFEVVVDLVQM